MASEYTLECQPETFYRTIFPECFQCVLGAGRRESASRRLEWRNAHLIEADEHDEREDDDLLYDGFHAVPFLHGVIVLSR